MYFPLNYAKYDLPLVWPAYKMLSILASISEYKKCNLKVSIYGMYQLTHEDAPFDYRLS